MAKILLFVGLILPLMAGFTVSDAANDQQECASQLMKLVPCLNYVQGMDKLPTGACCRGLVQVYSSSPKCLCLLMANNRSDDELGADININQTLALQMPVACGVAANISKCPDLLHIPPNSPEAVIFRQNTTTGSAPHIIAKSNFPPMSTPDTFSLGSQDHIAWAVLSMSAMLNFIILACM